MSEGKNAKLIAEGRLNLSTRRVIPIKDRAFLIREAANYEQVLDALEAADARNAVLEADAPILEGKLDAALIRCREVEAERDASDKAFASLKESTGRADSERIDLRAERDAAVTVIEQAMAYCDGREEFIEQDARELRTILRRAYRANPEPKEGE